MGAVLEMRSAALALVSTLALLAGCGNDSAADYAAPGQAIAALLSGQGRPPPGMVTTEDDPAVQEGLRAFRANLEADGQPILLASNATLKYGTLHAPFGRNGDVQTWASTGYQQISLRDGVMVATRGFGPDLMSAAAPSIATIARGNGTTRRQYFYLDGADQRQVVEYTCNLAVAGSESITVMTKVHATRKVTESCSGPAGSFTNSYWFENGLNLRQSSQFLAPGLDNMFMQRVVD